MEKLVLVRPTEELREAALDYKEEHLRQGETVLHGSALFDSMEFEPWLKLTQENALGQTVRPDWVQASTFFVFRQSDGRLVGMVDIRHELNAFLAAYGGHIGYGVRPSERQKGYATQMLRMALDFARSIGLRQVMVACYKENEASRRTILKCGGAFEREFIHTDGKAVEVYWLEIGERA